MFVLLESLREDWSCCTLGATFSSSHFLSYIHYGAMGPLFSHIILAHSDPSKLRLLGFPWLTSLFTGLRSPLTPTWQSCWSVAVVLWRAKLGPFPKMHPHTATWQVTLLPSVVPLLLLLSSIKLEPHLVWLVHPLDFNVTSKDFLRTLVHRYSGRIGRGMGLPNPSD